MSALEQEIIDKIRKLDANQQKQILQHIESIKPKEFDADEWFRQVEEFRSALRGKYGIGHVNAQGLLDELREEASWPRE